LEIHRKIFSNLFLFFMTDVFSSSKRIIAGVVFLLALGSVIAAGYAVTQENYTIYIDDGPPQTVTGNFSTVAEVLAAAGIETRSEDLIVPALAETADQS
jgi:uncharacterized protein YabE (DUF348 family)